MLEDAVVVGVIKEQFKNTISILDGSALITTRCFFFGYLNLEETHLSIQAICFGYGCKGAAMLRRMATAKDDWSLKHSPPPPISKPIGRHQSHFTVNRKDTQSCAHWLF